MLVVSLIEISSRSHDWCVCFNNPVLGVKREALGPVVVVSLIEISPRTHDWCMCFNNPVNESPNTLANSC